MCCAIWRNRPEVSVLRSASCVPVRCPPKVGHRDKSPLTQKRHICTLVAGWSLGGLDHMKTMLFGLLAAAGLALATPAAAATVERTYEIAFTQNGLGDAGPDWFGRLSVLCDGSVRICDGSVRIFSAVIDGVTYDSFAPRLGATSLIDKPDRWPEAILSGFVFSGVPSAGTQSPYIQFFNFAREIDGVLTYFNSWTRGSCDTGGICGGGFAEGTYTLSLVPVPLPATAMLLPLGFGALAMLRRRKRAKSAA